MHQSVAARYEDVGDGAFELWLRVPGGEEAMNPFFLSDTTRSGVGMLVNENMRGIMVATFRGNLVMDEPGQLTGPIWQALVNRLGSPIYTYFS